VGIVFQALMPTKSQQISLLNNLEGWLRQRILRGEAIPAYLSIPTNISLGSYLVLDFGGSNLRADLVELLAGGGYRIVAKTRRSLKDSQINFYRPEAAAADLFDYLAATIAEGVKGRERAALPIPLAHVFSYPVRQGGINSARLLKWTKELKVRGVVGEDVQQLLGKALDRNKVAGVSPVAILNDTVAVLMAGSYCYPGCGIGAVAGTGYNAAAFLNSSVGTESASRGVPPLAYNLEVGNFSKLPQGLSTPADVRLDRESHAPGEQLYEKMVGGAYLGEIFRLMALDLLDGTAEAAVVDWLRRPYSVTSAMVGKLSDLGVRDSLQGEALAGLSQLNAGAAAVAWQTCSEGCRSSLQALAQAILGRAGVLAALPLVAWWRTGLGGTDAPQVLVEGSLYSKSRIFRDSLDATLKSYGLEPCPPLADTVSLGGAVAAAQTTVYKNVTLS
jgi:hexokinase